MRTAVPIVKKPRKSTAKKMSPQAPLVKYEFLGSAVQFGIAQGQLLINLSTREVVQIEAVMSGGRQ